MAATHKPFRELLPPGTNFEFVGKNRTWVIVSIFLVLGSIAMLFVNQATRGSILNWTVDFKGGTEMVFAFDGDKEIKPGDVRGALSAAGYEGVEVSEFKYAKPMDDGTEVQVNGVRVRTPDFSAVGEGEQTRLAREFRAAFGGQEAIQKVSWSGDTMFVRSRQPIQHEPAAAFFEKQGLELKPWTEQMRTQFLTPEEGTREYNLQFPLWGIDRQYQTTLQGALGGVNVDVVNVYGVGPKAGEQLRDDGIKAMFYAVVLIMLYLVFRFDVRYAPGAVAALLHDAIIVVGVFALTWTDFSLTTVAALLTVIGYSVNDTVVIFDRIRENTTRLKDKRFARIINISLNETMSRTLLTSLTLLVVTLMMNIFGTGLVANFAFAMNIGVIVGVYSSVFIASPVVLWIHTKYFSAPRKAAAA